MTKTLIIIFSLGLLFSTVSGQEDTNYVKSNAVRIDKPDSLNDAVFQLLNPFQLIIFGEMHGTNESARLIYGMNNLFTSRGDSVQVGLEIPSSQMMNFLMNHTDSSIYQSEFFTMEPLSGKETTAWAELISKLNKNPRVNIFFFDINQGEGKTYQRDSLMSAKIKSQFNQHPGRKMITLCGNYHNRISDEHNMASFLIRDGQIKICSLNMEYSGGYALANFGKGLEIKQLSSYPNAYNSTLAWDEFLLLVPATSTYPYHGLFFTRGITPATLTRHE